MGKATNISALDEREEGRKQGSYVNGKPVIKTWHNTNFVTRTCGLLTRRAAGQSQPMTEV